jgi:UDP-N-acetylmuramoyl-L-alanyl-D-glutamate--2,6-diaminopimelate ligase
MTQIKSAIKKLLPEKVLKEIRPIGHGFLAYVAAARAGFPSRRLVVIGITGTAGKSSTVQMLATILNKSGHKTGYITTVGSFDGNNEVVNKHGMSMPGGSMIQNELLRMVSNGCTHAIIEATSEGLAQNRHLGIDFDMALITNLAPAHLDAHGGFENYKRAKGKLFSALEKSYRKDFFRNKTIGVALPNDYADYFLSFDADNKFFARVVKEVVKDHTNYIDYSAQLDGENGFVFGGQKFKINLPGEFNLRNAFFATAAADQLGVSAENSAFALETVSEIAGRMQKVANERGVQIFVDYAPEPIAMQNALEAVSKLPHNKLIHVFGSTGGHRDVQKRFEFGKISARFADVVVVTNDDVYDSDPQKIADDVVTGIRRSDAVPHAHVVLDRKQAIHKALGLAGPGDIVIFTGKGSEQFLVLPGDKRIPWDEKTEIQKVLESL